MKRNYVFGLLLKKFIKTSEQFRDAFRSAKSPQGYEDIQRIQIIEYLFLLDYPDLYKNFNFNKPPIICQFFLPPTELQPTDDLNNLMRIANAKTENDAVKIGLDYLSIKKPPISGAYWNVVLAVQAGILKGRQKDFLFSNYLAKIGAAPIEYYQAASMIALERFCKYKNMNAGNLIINLGLKITSYVDGLDERTTRLDINAFRSTHLFRILTNHPFVSQATTEQKTVKVPEPKVENSNTCLIK